MSRTTRAALAAALCLLAVPSAARASFSGFGDFSAFSVNQNDSNSAPTVGVGALHLTNPSSGEFRSVFYDVPQSITGFTATFTYQAQNVYAIFSGGGGASFVVQNSAAGARAVGGDSNSTVGDWGIASSEDISLELGAGTSASGLYTEGSFLGGSSPTTPLNLTAGDPIDVTLTYNGSLLQETLVDSVTSATFSTAYLTNIAAAVGGSTAYVGLTAANTGNGGGAQTFSNFQFTTSSVPEPSVVGPVAAVAGASLLRRRRGR